MLYFFSRGQFEDEIVDDLKHTGAGILSMANRYNYSKGPSMIIINLFFIFSFSFSFSFSFLL